LGQRDPSPQTKEYLSNALLLVTVDSAKGLPVSWTQLLLVSVTDGTLSE